jgi:hypothetical protein
MPDLTHAQLTAQVTALGKTIARDNDALRGHAQAILDEVKDTARTAEAIAAMRVDDATIAETRELASFMEGVTTATTAYTAAGDTTAKMAQAARAQNTASHSGIGEALARSTVGYDTDREWLRQE